MVDCEKELIETLWLNLSVLGLSVVLYRVTFIGILILYLIKDRKEVSFSELKNKHLKNRSMKRIIVACVAVLLGTSVATAQNRLGKQKKSKDFSIDRIAEKLNLDENQKEAFKQYREKEATSRKEMKEDVKKQAQEKKAERDAFMKKTLTPEQYKQWTEMQSKQIKKATKGKGLKGHKQKGRRNKRNK